eukprot:1536-Heterococcus_DN1.PRE.3
MYQQLLRNPALEPTYCRHSSSCCTQLTNAAGYGTLRRACTAQCGRRGTVKRSYGLRCSVEQTVTIYVAQCVEQCSAQCSMYSQASPQQRARLHSMGPSATWYNE